MVNCNQHHSDSKLAIHDVDILKIIAKPKTSIMYHMHTFVTSTCTHLVHSGEVRFSEYIQYLN